MYIIVTPGILLNDVSQKRRIYIYIYIYNYPFKSQENVCLQKGMHYVYTYIQISTYSQVDLISCILHCEKTKTIQKTQKHI